MCPLSPSTSVPCLENKCFLHTLCTLYFFSQISEFNSHTTRLFHPRFSKSLLLSFRLGVLSAGSTMASPVGALLWMGSRDVEEPSRSYCFCLSSMELLRGLQSLWQFLISSLQTLSPSLQSHSHPLISGRQKGICLSQHRQLFSSL